MPGTFPALSSGAVAQYPLERQASYRTETVRFLNQAEQVYQDVANAVRRWTIKLELLNAREIAALRDLFEANRGRWGTFSFTDPYDSVLYSNCAFADDQFPIENTDAGLYGQTLTIYTRPT